MVNGNRRAIAGSHFNYLILWNFQESRLKSLVNEARFTRQDLPNLEVLTRCRTAPPRPEIPADLSLGRGRDGADDALDIPLVQRFMERKSQNALPEIVGDAKVAMRKSGESGLPVTALAPPLPRVDPGIRERIRRRVRGMLSRLPFQLTGAQQRVIAASATGRSNAMLQVELTQPAPKPGDELMLPTPAKASA